MTETNTLYFNLLKKRTAATFLAHNVGPKNISEWKGETIVAFQEDLLHKTKGRISEKSFYTYFKKDTEKLPRIDILNLLSIYSGYSSWEAFKTAHQTTTPKQQQLFKKKKAKYSAFLFLLAIIALVIISFVVLNRTHEFTFCLIDEDQNTAITTPIKIEILKENESSIHINTDSTGCFTYKTTKDRIRFVVQSPYHKKDTIIRTITSNTNTRIPLITDNYALMLKYYSNGNFTDVQKRRQQLETLIATNAQIYQIYPNATGIELYSKKEFINKLTIPTSSLKNIHILDKAYHNGQITKLKFIVE